MIKGDYATRKLPTDDFEFDALMERVELQKVNRKWVKRAKGKNLDGTIHVIVAVGKSLRNAMVLQRADKN
jgi:hypothetical protein